MRSVRFVSSEADRDVVIVELAEAEADGDPERFELPVDDALRAALGAGPEQDDATDSATDSATDGAAPASATPARPALELTPRDIQVRVRAGEDPGELAEETGMSLARIMRFADAVLAERARVSDEARRSRARRDGDGALVPFGETVDRRLTHHGIEPTSVIWDSSRRSDGSWLVTARWHGDGPERQAHWVFSLAQRTLLPGDEAAADLLSERALRPVVQAVPTPSDDDTATIPAVAAGTEVYETVFDQEAEDPPPVPAPRPTAPRPVESRPVESRPAASARAGTAPARPRDTSAAKPGGAAPLRRPEPVLRLADPLPIFGEVEADDDIIPFEQDPLDAPAGRSAQVEHSAGEHPGTDHPDAEHPGAVRNGEKADGDEHNGDDHSGDEDPAPPRRGSGRSKAAREQTRIPSWDDILLGVRRKQD